MFTFCQFTGAFSRFLPTLPYPFIGGDNSPPINTHSPPSAAMTNLPVTPTVLRPHPHMPSSTAGATSHLSNGGSPPTGPTATISPLRIRVSSPNRINADLTSLGGHPHALPAQNRANGIVRIVGGAATNATSGISVGPPMLHRPFSPSPQPKDVS